MSDTSDTSDQSDYDSSGSEDTQPGSFIIVPGIIQPYQYEPVPPGHEQEAVEGQPAQVEVEQPRLNGNPRDW